jgi:hypothetical protein
MPDNLLKCFLPNSPSRTNVASGRRGINKIYC